MIEEITLLADYWKELLKNNSFKKNHGFSIDWKFEGPPRPLSRYHWSYYKKDDFVVGLLFEKGIHANILKEFIIVYKPNSNNFIKIQDRLGHFRPLDLKILIEGLSNPKLLPLSIGIPWADYLIEALYKPVTAPTAK